VENWDSEILEFWEAGSAPGFQVFGVPYFGRFNRGWMGGPLSSVGCQAEKLTLFVPTNFRGYLPRTCSEAMVAAWTWAGHDTPRYA
jgi:hypothetical protein